MSHPRFYVPSLPSTGCIDLDPVEARHASNVLRLAAGDAVSLFDGLGHEALAYVEGITKRSVSVKIEHRHALSRELPLGLEMIVALPKGDRQKTLVDGLTQLGVTRLTPLTTIRTVAQPTRQTVERLARVVIETSKQCGRNRLMEIREPASIAELASSPQPETLAICAHPYGSAMSLSTALATPATSARIIIGPEGGLVDEELQSLVDAGWKQISLGERILRVELAAIAAAACWAFCSRQDLR